MKKSAIIILMSIMYSLNAQTTIYSWPKKDDPKWTSSDSSLNTLCYHGWNNDINVVSTSSKKETFNNNQITTYTSGVMNLSDVVELRINMILGIKLKDVVHKIAYDWLYFQYSLDGGLNWINPVKESDYTNDSNIDLKSYGLGINNNKGWSGNMSESEKESYSIKPTNKTVFRYVFASNKTINKGNSNGDIYHADIRDFELNNYTPLPIELLSFAASIVEKGVELKWVTATESNNNYFEIYNSIDGINYTLVDKTKGAGNSSYEKDYTLLHIAPMEGYNYYKLKQVDFDGKNKEFQIVSIFVPKFDIIVGDITYYNMLGQVVNLKEVGIGYYIKITTIGKSVKKEKIYKSNM